MALDYTQPESSFEWYRKAVDRHWDPQQFDYEQDKIDWEEKFTEEEQHQFMKLCSLFYEGEESVAKTLAPYPLAVGALEDVEFDTLQEEMYLSTQIYEEAKHTEFFSIYFEEVFGTQNTETSEYHPEESFWVPELREYLIDDLDQVSHELLQAIDEDQETLRHKLGEAVAHYMGGVEAELARVGYEGLEQMLDRKGALPGFQAAMNKIQEDEGRHIANGRWLLGQLAEEDPTIVEEVYKPHFEYFMDTVLGPATQNIVNPNPLDLDAGLLFEKAQGNYQSTVDSIDSDDFTLETTNAAAD
jgi:ribonucleoside-diphosphate reductase beta chain